MEYYAYAAKDSIPFTRSMIIKDLRMFPTFLCHFCDNGWAVLLFCVKNWWLRPSAWIEPSKPEVACGSGVNQGVSDEPGRVDDQRHAAVTHDRGALEGGDIGKLAAHRFHDDFNLADKPVHGDANSPSMMISRRRSAS